MQTTVQCQGNTGSVTWEASFGAVAYEVRLAGRDGHSLSCYNNDTFCDVEGLHCGVTYHTNVIAIGETLNSSVSTTVLLVSGAPPEHSSLMTLKYFSACTMSELCVTAEEDFSRENRKKK